MGEMAEYYLEQELLNPDFDFGDIQELTWLTKDEGEIKVKNMKDSHLKNCINMLRRKKEDADFWIAIFEDELYSRRKTNYIDTIRI
jgi:hypothetical protein